MRLQASLCVPGKGDENIVEVARQFPFHHQAIEKPPERPELDGILERLRDARTELVRLDMRDPAHEVNGPIALDDLEADGPPLLPVRDALDDSAFGHELTGAPRADPASLNAFDRGLFHAGVVALDGFESREERPDALGRAGSLNFVVNRGHRLLHK